LAYAAEGAGLAVCSRNGHALARVAAELRAGGARVMAMAADVSRAEDVHAFCQRVIAAYGRIDVLVNNAGVTAFRGPLLETPREAWERTLAVNVTGAFLCAGAIAPTMKAQRSGCIINVSSRLGRGLVVPSWGPYAVSKWALEGLTTYLADELRGDGISVNSVAPGLLATEMTGHVGAPPETVVDVFRYLASAAGRRITGRALSSATWRHELSLPVGERGSSGG
jgi:NAD(P)-dependent dehydrogenase (short-subunit alcohol dehydrogenase family)